MQRPGFGYSLRAGASCLSWDPVPAGTDLIGAGAIGKATTWALPRIPLAGTIHIVDPEPLDLGSLQRYVLGTAVDVGKAKATFARPVHQRPGRGIATQLTAIAHDSDWVNCTPHR